MDLKHRQTNKRVLKEAYDLGMRDMLLVNVKVNIKMYKKLKIKMYKKCNENCRRKRKNIK